MYDNWNCICCGLKMCNCGWWAKCSCTKQTDNEQMKKVLQALWIWVNGYKYWTQTEETKAIIQYMREEYILQWKSIDVSAVITKYKKEEPELYTTKNVTWTKCQFNIWMWTDVCIHCWRPKWHVDVHWGNCNVLMWLI